MASRVKSKIRRMLRDLELQWEVADAIATKDYPEPDVYQDNVDIGHAESEADISDITSETDHESTPGRAPRNHEYLHMEKRVLQLMHDNKALQLRHETVTKAKDLEIAELQKHLQTAIKDMEHRQKEIEARAPLFRLKMEDFHDQLKDLVISDAQYSELKQLPRENLHVLDEVKVAVYEATAQLKKENERVRLAITTSRDAAARAEEEAAKHRVENSRLAAGMVEKQRDLQLATEGMQARVERLASELEQAMVKVELLSAKGQMYDDLKAKTDRLEQENQRLQVVEASYKRLEQQSHELQLYAKQKEHTYEMLMMDKAYLSKQVEFLGDAQRKLQQEAEERNQLVTELQRSKQELYDKLVHAEANKGRADEARLQKELQQLQTTTQANVERIRTDTSEAYEREARLLRQLRDEALEDAGRAKISLSELQDLHERTKASHAELQRRMESQVVQLQTELKQRAFELSHLRVVVAEREELLEKANMQADRLQEKLQVSMERCRILEADLAYAVKPGQPGVAGQALAVAGASAAAVTGSDGGSLVEQRIQIQDLQRSKDKLSSQVSQLQSQLDEAKEMVRLSSQPHGFLLEELQATRAKLQQAEVKLAAVQAALKLKEQEAADLSSERTALKKDLDVLLAQRAQIDSMKQTLMKALGAMAAGSGQQQQQGSGAGAGVRPGQRPATTIMGEGS